MEKIGFVSLGCSKNLIDTEVMLGILRDRHMEITDDLEEADIIIVNTCTFIEKAKQESIDTILQAARYKTEGRCQILIVTGCLSQQYKEELMKEMPEIDVLLGTGSWDRIWDAIDTVKKEEKPVLWIMSAICIIRIRAGCVRHHLTVLTSKSGKAAITVVPSASFPMSGAAYTAVLSIRSWQKSGSWLMTE